MLASAIFDPAFFKGTDKAVRKNHFADFGHLSCIFQMLAIGFIDQQNAINSRSKVGSSLVREKVARVRFKAVSSKNSSSPSNSWER